MFIKTTSVTLLLLLFTVVTFSDADARCFCGMWAGGGMRAGGRTVLGGQIRLSRSRGGRRGGYSSTANPGPTVERQQARYIQERSTQSPYSSVPEHVNASDYVRTYR